MWRKTAAWARKMALQCDQRSNDGHNLPDTHQRCAETGLSSTAVAAISGDIMLLVVGGGGGGGLYLACVPAQILLHWRAHLS